MKNYSTPGLKFNCVRFIKDCTILNNCRHFIRVNELIQKQSISKKTPHTRRSEGPLELAWPGGRGKCVVNNPVKIWNHDRPVRSGYKRNKTPVIDLASYKVVKTSACVRWNSPSLSLGKTKSPECILQTHISDSVLRSLGTYFSNQRQTLKEEQENTQQDP